jgi:hypothetical protein
MVLNATPNKFQIYVCGWERKYRGNQTILIEHTNPTYDHFSKLVSAITKSTDKYAQRLSNRY